MVEHDHNKAFLDERIFKHGLKCTKLSVVNLSDCEHGWGRNGRVQRDERDIITKEFAVRVARGERVVIQVAAHVGGEDLFKEALLCDLGDVVIVVSRDNTDGVFSIGDGVDDVLGGDEFFAQRKVAEVARDGDMVHAMILDKVLDGTFDRAWRVRFAAFKEKVCTAYKSFI